MSFSEPSLKGRALRLLSQREHSRHELTQKLRQYEASEGELQRTLDELQAKGFIDEQRVLESVLHRRSGQWGNTRLRQDLLAKGLPAQAVAEAMARLKESELARAQDVWRKKFGVAAQSVAEQGKQARFLLTRGFAPETVRRVVGGLKSPASA